jgi:hypothetical protein
MMAERILPTWFLASGGGSGCWQHVRRLGWAGLAIPMIPSHPSLQVLASSRHRHRLRPLLSAALVIRPTLPTVVCIIEHIEHGGDE